MCRAVKCNNCKKTTWAGCGKHVDSVMKNIAQHDRCACSQAQSSSSKGLFAKVFGA